MAQPKPYPGDEYIKQLVAQMGFFKLDENRNLVIGLNLNTDGRSVSNIILKDNITLHRSHDNLVNAKNAVLYHTNAATINGADHTIGWRDLNDPDKRPNGNGADHCTVSGDACVVAGYSSITMGYGLKNAIAYGVCIGKDLILGRMDSARILIPNEFQNSSAIGTKITVIGNNSHGKGSNFTILGDNVIVIGTGIGQIITEPGVHILNQV
jgi:hypothetical protein